MKRYMVGTGIKTKIVRKEEVKFGVNWLLTFETDEETIKELKKRRKIITEKGNHRILLIKKEIERLFEEINSKKKEIEQIKELRNTPLFEIYKIKRF